MAPCRQRDWLALTWRLFICLLIPVFTGCAAIEEFALGEKKDSKPKWSPPAKIAHKIYKKPPLTRMQLDVLLRMALYEGPPEEYGTIRMEGQLLKRKEMAPAVFAHWRHRPYFTCRVCHLEMDFSMVRGGTMIRCSDNRAGYYCGTCHNGNIAFDIKKNCTRCHMKGNKRLKEMFLKTASRLPRKHAGDTIDWVRALDEGIIKPKGSLAGDKPYESMSMPKTLETPLAWYTADSRIYVLFPHKEHVEWLDCSNCHPDIFNVKNMGTEAFDKEKNLYGLYCGACHMRVSFPMNNCHRCHPGVKDR